MDLVRVELFCVLLATFSVTLALVSLFGKDQRGTKIDWVSTNCKFK